MQRYAVVLKMVRKMELSDEEDPRSSVELEDVVEELENDGWSVEVRSVEPAGDEDLERA